MLPSQIIEQGWTQNANARDVYGQEVEWNSDEACKRCANAAIAYAFKDNSDNLTLEMNYIIKLSSKINTYSVVSWNDYTGRTKEQVLQLMQQVEKEMNLASKIIY